MKFFILFWFCLSAFSPILSAKTIHLLILGDTADKNLGLSVRKNMRNIQQSFSYIASLSECKFKEKRLTSTEETKKERYQIPQELIRAYNPPHHFQTPQYRVFLHIIRRK